MDVLWTVVKESSSVLDSLRRASGHMECAGSHPWLPGAVSPHNLVFAQCTEPISQWPGLLPIASVVGDQEE